MAGTVQMLADHDIPYRCIHEYESYDGAGKIVCYSGGGCLVPYYSFAREFLARHHQRAAHVVLLPHTVDGNEDLLARFGANVTLICREVRSYEHCRRVATNADVHAADDLAFSLAVRNFLTRPAGALGRRDEAVDAKMRERYRDFFLDRSAPSKTLVVWREDVERSNRRKDPAQHDIANTFGIEFIYGPAAMLTSAEYFLRAVDQFQAIRTDRLHVAVAGASLTSRSRYTPTAISRIAPCTTLACADFRTCGSSSGRRLGARHPWAQTDLQMSGPAWSSDWRRALRRGRPAVRVPPARSA